MSRSWQVVLGSPANRRNVVSVCKICRQEAGAPFSKDHEKALSRLLVDAAAGRIYLVEVRGRPVGVACVSFQQSVSWAGRLAVLESLQLLKAYQGLGLAQRVLRAIIGDLENLGPAIIVAYVSETEPLAAVFELEGFCRTTLVRFADQNMFDAGAKDGAVTD